MQVSYTILCNQCGLPFRVTSYFNFLTDIIIMYQLRYIVFLCILTTYSIWVENTLLVEYSSDG
jgi:hypothetical protein